MHARLTIDELINFFTTTPPSFRTNLETGTRLQANHTAKVRLATLYNKKLSLSLVQCLRQTPGNEKSREVGVTYFLPRNNVAPLVDKIVKKPDVLRRTKSVKLAEV